jgi:hypothetical protein
MVEESELDVIEEPTNVLALTLPRKLSDIPKQYPVDTP